MNGFVKRSLQCVRPSLERLEARALLSVSASLAPHGSVPGIVARVSLPRIPFGGPGASYILSAIAGGAGHEWVALLDAEKGGISAQVIGGSVEYKVRGLVAESPPYLLPTYNGRAHDRVAPLAAGAVVLKHNRIELAALMRGPFTNFSGTDYVVWGINRGEGTSLAPILPSEPWVQADALVTIAVGTNGSTYSGTITDRTTGVTVPIDPRNIQVEGPVVRVLLGASQLPSRGWAVPSYRFALWTIDPLGKSPLGMLASIVPQQQMIPIGVETGVNPTMS